MLKPELLRELTLDPTIHPHQKTWLSAASGLACTNNLAYVVADDELHLGYFPCAQPWVKQQQHAPVEFLQLFAGELPHDEKQRKKVKPDLESLMLLPASKDWPAGALLTLGSGSKPPRCRALMLALNARGSPNGERLQFDLTEFYAPLHKHFDDLNIEGVFLHNSQLRLLQRGNKKHNANACISYNSQDFFDWMLKRRKQAPAIQSVLPLDFGSVDGVPLCPTDGVALPNGGWLMSVVAEATDSSYQDGSCVGSALAVMNADDKLSALHMLEQGPKVEGLALLGNGTNQTVEVLMVTDADNPELAAQLLRITLPLG